MILFSLSVGYVILVVMTMSGVENMEDIECNFTNIMLVDFIINFI